MAITFHTGILGRCALRGIMGEPLQSSLFGADFRSQAYNLDGNLATFEDLFTHVRLEAMTYFDPNTNAIEPVAINEPLFFDPRGRRGLYLSSVQGAICTGMPTAPGMSHNSFASNRDGTACILEVFGAPGAWLKVSGDIQPTFSGGNLEGGRFQHIYLTLRPSVTRNVIVEFNGAVRGWKLSVNPFEEFGGAVFSSGSNTPPTLSATPAVLARLNGASRFNMRGKLRLMGHRGTAGNWGKSLALEDAKGNGVHITIRNGTWALISSQTVAAGGQAIITWPVMVTPYLLAEGRSQDLDFVMSVDKPTRLVAFETRQGRVVTNIPLPVMGPITTLSAGRHDGNLPKMALDYLAANIPI